MEQRTLDRLKELKEQLDVLLLGVLRGLALDAVPGVPLVAAGLVEEARTLGVDVTLGGLLVERVHLELLGLVDLQGTVLGQVLDDVHGGVELRVESHGG